MRIGDKLVLRVMGKQVGDVEALYLERVTAFENFASKCVGLALVVFSRSVACCGYLAVDLPC